MTLRSLTNFIVYSRYLVSPTAVPRRWPYIALMNACPASMICSRLASSSPKAVERPGKSQTHIILSADTLPLPYIYDVVSDTVKYWIPKRCEHFRPISAQVELMSQIVPSAMWQYTQQTTARRDQRDHAYHSRAKLGSHHQMRYHRYICFTIGNTPSRQLSRVTPFQKL